MRSITITNPVTVEELIKSLKGLPSKAVISLRNGDTGEKFILNSVDLVHPELVVIDVEENIEEDDEEEEG